MDINYSAGDQVAYLPRIHTYVNTRAHTHTLPGNVHASPWVHKEVSVHDKYMINSVNMTHEPTIIIRNANIRTETNKFREEFAHIKQGLVPKHT